MSAKDGSRLLEAVHYIRTSMPGATTEAQSSALAGAITEKFLSGTLILGTVEEVYVDVEPFNTNIDIIAKAAGMLPMVEVVASNKAARACHMLLCALMTSSTTCCCQHDSMVMIGCLESCFPNFMLAAVSEQREILRSLVRVIPELVSKGTQCHQCQTTCVDKALKQLLRITGLAWTPASIHPNCVTLTMVLA